MGDYMDLTGLTIEELAGVISIYPWFGGARKELCERMASMGSGSCSKEQFYDAALYVGSRGIVSDMMRSASVDDWSDSDVEKLIKKYLDDRNDIGSSVAPKEKRKSYAGVGDYFSQEDYEQVRHSDDHVFSRYAAKAKQERVESGVTDVDFDLYTETLAQIYAEQGYYDHAKSIYSKLILAYPEKNAYFAALIQKLEEFN